MLGKRSDQRGLWEADRLYLDYVGKDTFYGLLASLRGQLFSDDNFAEIYCPDNGRDSVPPSLLATALLLQEARALQQSADYDEYRARRMVAAHRMARLVQLGIHQSHYFGSVKTRLQLYLAATVANLTLVLGTIGLSGSTGGGAEGNRVVFNDVRAVDANAAAHFSVVCLGQLSSLIFLVSALPPKSLYPTRVFRPGF